MTNSGQDRRTGNSDTNKDSCDRVEQSGSIDRRFRRIYECVRIDAAREKHDESGVDYVQLTEISGSL